MVNLRLLAVSRGVDGRHRHVGVALDSQLEGRAVVRLGTAEPTDDDAGIKRIRGEKELNGELFLGLGKLPLALGRRDLEEGMCTSSTRALPVSFTVNG